MQKRFCTTLTLKKVLKLASFSLNLLNLPCSERNFIQNVSGITRREKVLHLVFDLLHIMTYYGPIRLVKEWMLFSACYMIAIG